MIWEGPLGTVAVIGIATKEAAAQCHGYVALLGSDSESWGWNLVDNHLLHNGDSQGNYPQLNNAPKYQVETISVRKLFVKLSLKAKVKSTSHALIAITRMVKDY